MPRVKIPREKSLIMPEVKNPFVLDLKLTWPQKIQITLMTFTVFPIRLVLVTILLALTWLFAYIALLGKEDKQLKEPLTGWRSALRPVVVFFARAVFFAGGFHWIRTRGKRSTAVQAPILVMAPHSSYFDALPDTYLDLTTVVAKSTAERVPLFGTLTRFTQPVFVSREDPNSRQNTIKEIQRRAVSGGKWPQIVVFAEGTCTNRSCLISFKPGAFYPGVPVQPVCLTYPNQLDTITWTWEGPGAFKVLWFTLCQFNNNLEIEFLPVYTPSEDEKKDAKLFAKNVREKMAECLGVPTTDHTFEDCRLMAYAAKLNLPAAAGLVEFHKLSKKLGMNLDNLKELLKKFCQIAQNDRGYITIEEFAKYLDMPVSEPLKQMFQMYDRDGSSTIDFREYVIGLHLVAEPANTDQTIQFAFQLFDRGAKGYITEPEFTEILEDALGMDELDVHTLFVQVDADADGKITYGEFAAYAKEKPEYAGLFRAYHDTADDVPEQNSKHKAD